MDTILETERLILRPFTLEDVPAAHTMDHDAEVNRYTGETANRSLAEIGAIIQDRVMADYAKHGFGRFAIFHKQDQKVIGFAGLKYLEDYKEVDLGYRLRSAYWGKGLATEAAHASVDFGFKTLGLKKIVAMVIPKNIASVKVCEKLGFVQTKTVKEDGIETHWFELENQKTS